MAVRWEAGVSSSLGSVTILVVEDDEFIRATTVDALSELGWTVLEAENALLALEVIEGESRVDLVFSDIQMPGKVDGVGLAAWMQEHRPHTPVILTSGLVRDIGAALPDVDLIAKPYTHAEVIAGIWRRLKPRREQAAPLQVGVGAVRG